MLSTSSNITNVAFHYLQKLNIPVTKTSLQNNLQNNPYYPSLYSLSNVFERFNIDNQAYKINKEKFGELQHPFIAYLKNQPTGKDFVLVTSIADNEVKYLAEGSKIKTVNKESFLKDWENIVLIAEPKNKSGEADYIINHKKEIALKNKNNSLVAGATFIFITIIFTFLNTIPSAQVISASALVLIKSLGLAITIVLLIYEIDKSNSFVKSMCTAGKQTNCNAVLQSKGAKVFGMSWSEAGFFYFVATFLFLLLPTISFEEKVWLLSIVNCIAVPYIFFSLYYQWKVVKQWCPLCLTVQAILAIELIWSIINYWSHPYFQVTFLPSILLTMALCLLFPVVLWYILKPLLKNAKDEPIYKSAYKRLLYNPETFYYLLQQQPTAPDGYQSIGINIGNRDAKNTVIKVCNPYCGPCVKAHQVLEDIIHSNKNVKMKLIFNTSNHINDKVNILSRHLLAINEQNNAIQIHKALDDWYLADIKDYRVFAKKYPMNGELLQLEAHVVAMSKWCKDAEIKGTPTFFINGKLLPQNYNIEELKYIL